MAQTPLLKAKGLYTFGNALNELPDGSLLEATNVVIDQEGVIEPRRGIDIYGTTAMGGRTFTSISIANPTTITTSTPHDLTTGDVIVITGSNSTPTVDGTRTVIVTGTSTFTVAVNVTVAGTTGSYAGISSSTDRAKQLLTYKGRILRHYNNKLEYDSDGAGAFSAFPGTFSEVDAGLRIKGVEANGNFYFTTSTGIRKIAATSAAGLASATPSDAGGIKALDIKLTVDTSGSGFLTNNYTVGYRIVWGFKDVNNNLILGTPSPLTLIKNTSGSSQNAIVEITIPAGVTVNHLFQIYRTPITTTDNPGDDLNLVYEFNPTSGEISAGLLSVTDIVTEALRETGALLYTNANSGEGILQANEPPPVAKDITLFKNISFYGNTKTRHKKIITLIGVVNLTSGTSSITLTPSIGSAETYTFNIGAEAILTKTVHLENASGSVSTDIDITARSFVRIVNRQTSGLFYAEYLSNGPDDLPGQILFYSRTLGDVSFSFTANSTATGNSFTPTIPTSGTTVASDNEIAPNRIYYSKTSQPEAVPLVNYFDVGAKDKVIYRILALRDSVFVLKQDGIFRVTGDSPSSLSTSLFDSSAFLNAPDTATILNNQIYMFTTQGISTVSDTGVSVISRPIENLLLPLTGYTNFATASFAINYENDRAYLLFVVTELDDTTATQCFRFNVFTNTWTKWDMAKTCGIINTDNTLYLGPIDVPYVEKERKSFTRLDYADRSFALTFDASAVVSDSMITYLNADDVTLQKGDVIIQTQFLTISQFNRLLKKLDTDEYLADANYYSTQVASSGNNLSTKLDSLITKIAADTGRIAHGGTAAASYTALIPTGASFATQQTNFDSLITLLNVDVGIYLSTYRYSSLKGNISSNSAANITVVTSPTPHQLSSGLTITITGSNSTPSINGTHVITSTSPTTFSIPVNVTMTGSAGSWTYARPTVWEVLVTDVTDEIVTLAYAAPLIQGSAIGYTNIPTTTIWAPYTFGDVSTGKQVREATIIFKNFAFSSGIASYASDLSVNFEPIEFNAEGNGVWGGGSWGRFNWGGEGTSIPFRTYIPREKQRCRYMNSKFEHNAALESFSLYGISYTFEPIGSRAYK